ncbi:hypothetical protein [Marinilactibacillus piezotolerans]|uniref:hypothetical protein n=1 Tax=Marinilactibacillus piezotolerans TaxID=258723 RepID=UPI0009B08973|nr:hypothetical protein [Marinilactibacillus piezotolerans]
MSEQRKSLLRLFATTALTVLITQILSIEASILVKFISYTLIGVSVFLLVNKMLEYVDEKISKRK